MLTNPLKKSQAQRLINELHILRMRTGSTILEFVLYAQFCREDVEKVSKLRRLQWIKKGRNR